MNNFTKFIFITGASGSGKTSLLNALEKKLDKTHTYIVYFDSIGVPSPEEMVKHFGSGEQWQKMATEQWIQKLSRIQKKLVILEGQYNPEFALSICQKYHIKNPLFLAINAERKIREKRLKELRNQPELITDDMEKWALFLNEKTLSLGGKIISTSASNLKRNLTELEDVIHEFLRE